MEKLLILITFFTFSTIVSCSNKDSGEFIRPSSSENVDLSASNRSSNSLIGTSTSYGYLFYKESNSTFYFVQTDSSYTLSSTLTYTSSSSDSLTISNNGVTLAFGLNSNAYGIGEFSGDVAEENLLTESGGTTIFVSDDDVLGNLSCKCTIGTGGLYCDHGGVGSSSCSVSTSEGSCSVSCDDGWTACCNEFSSGGSQ